jgi:hypothetical protein
LSFAVVVENEAGLYVELQLFRFQRLSTVTDLNKRRRGLLRISGDDNLPPAYSTYKAAGLLAATKVDGQSCFAFRTFDFDVSIFGEFCPSGELSFEKRLALWHSGSPIDVG